MSLLRDDPDHTRLPGGGRTPTGKASYWLAPDHLLVVEVQFMTESYRRFDLQEIQAVTLVATRRRLWMNLGIVAFSLALCVPGSVMFFLPGQAAEDQMSGFLLGIPFGLLVAALLVNNLLGSTCRVELQTAVQTVPLPSLTRWRQAEKFLTALAPAVRAAQTSLVRPVESVIAPEPTAVTSPEPSSDPDLSAPPHSSDKPPPATEN